MTNTKQDTETEHAHNTTEGGREEGLGISGGGQGAGRGRHHGDDDQGGDKGKRSQARDRRNHSRDERSRMMTQRHDGMKVHSGADGGRDHGGD